MRNPYKGIYSYTVKDKDYFWGRDKEISDFTESILNSTSIILTGYSGCGKTSLIKAGILPKLSGYDYHVISLTPRDVYEYERRNRFAFDFWERINLEIEKWLNPNFNNSIIKLSMNNRITNKKSRKNTLWEKLFFCDFCDEDDFVHNFVIVLDQFEEIFQLDLNIKEIEKFFKIYEMLCGSYIPSYSYNENNKLYDIELADGTPQDVKKEYHIFPYDESSYAFKINTEKFYSYNRFLISIRKDFLYDLQSYSAKYPILNHNTKYIEHLDDDQAKIVIDRGLPNGLKEIDGFDSKSITECIVQQSDFNNSDGETDYYVDTLTLSVVMYQLWEDCNKKAEEKAHSKLAKSNVLSGSDNYDKLFNDYYVDFFKTEIKITNENGYEEKFKNILNDFYNDRINALKKESLIRIKEKKSIIRDICTHSIITRKISLNNIDSIIESIFKELENDIIFTNETVYEESIGDILDKQLNRTDYDDTFKDNSDNNETVIKSVRQEIINVLKKFSLTDIIKRCPNVLVKEKLLLNLDKIINELQVKLLSDSGLYRQSLYIYEIGKIFDKYLYGDIDFKNIVKWICPINDGYVIKNNSWLKYILDSFSIEKQFIVEKELKKSIDVLRDGKKNNKEKSDAERKCREEFNNFVYGNYKDKTNDDSKYIRNEIITVIENCKLFVELNKGGKASMLEFRHDRLCEMAKEYMEIYKIKQLNAKKYTADVYLTPQGRLKADNCLVECILGPWNTYSTIMRTIYFMESNNYSGVDFDVNAINQCKKVNYNSASSVIVSLAFNEYEYREAKKEFYHNLPENFTHMRIKIEQGKIYNISFERREVEDNKDEVVRKVVIPTGYHKVRFYYDDYNRIVFKEFCVRDITNTTDIRTLLPDGYNAIFYWYDDISSLFPTQTYFVNITDSSIKLNNEQDKYYYKNLKTVFDSVISDNKQLCNDLIKSKYPIILQHLVDGNYGYESNYDRYGREEARIFIGKKDNEFNEIHFIYKSENHNKYSDLIHSISFYNNNGKTSYPNSDVHTVQFVKYDDNNRITKTKYLDVDGNDCKSGHNNIIGEEFAYSDTDVVSNYILAENPQTGDSSGVHKVNIHKKSEDNRVQYIEWQDKDGKSKEGRQIEALEINGKYFKYDKIAQDEIKKYITLDDDCVNFEQNDIHHCLIQCSRISFEDKHGVIATLLTGSTRIHNDLRLLNNDRLWDIKLPELPMFLQPKQYGIKTITISDDVSIDMVLVKGGSYDMGYAPETNRNGKNIEDKYEYKEACNVHKVNVGSFYIGQTTVTLKQWNCLMNTDKKNCSKGEEDFPVVYVSWNDAQRFIDKLNEKFENKRFDNKKISFRLPSEEEWEYAARGGCNNNSETNDYKYSGSDDIYKVAVFTKNNEGKRSFVKSKEPNNLGIYDMSGNVQEWCYDSFALYPNSNSKVNKESGQGYLRVLRGGGWKNTEQQCRVYHRYCAFPDTRNSNIGFRIVMDEKN